MMYDIAIGIFLGYDEAWAGVTGGLTFINIVKAEIILNIVLFSLFLIVTKKRPKTKENSLNLVKLFKKAKKPYKKHSRKKNRDEAVRIY